MLVDNVSPIFSITEKSQKTHVYHWKSEKKNGPGLLKWLLNQPRPQGLLGIPKWRGSAAILNEPILQTPNCLILCARARGKARNLTAIFRIFSSRIILNRFSFDGRHFNSTTWCIKACWALPKLCTMRAVSSHEGTCRWNISLGHVAATFSCVCKCCDFVPATCPRYTSLLHVASVCTTQVLVAATCRCDMTPRVCPP